MRKFSLVFLALVLVLSAVPPALAAQTPVAIDTPEKLQALREDPAGSYVLTADLDMTGFPWEPVDFTGTLDGGGHSILNLTLSDSGMETETVYDGNLRSYEAACIGLFGTLKGAQVKDLHLVNVRAQVERDTPCFLGGFAGVSDGSTFTGCSVTGNLELRAHDRMFGVAGFVGYGNGTVENCRAEVTLINVDTDREKRDEQFLGGIYGVGFFHVLDTEVVIDGYISEHGYVHSGGIGGMFMRYPLKHNDTGLVKGCTVTGKITFFERNSDRRAYCDAYIGEVLLDNYQIVGNTRDFQRDEKWNYDTELRPETCEMPQYHQTVAQPGCDTFGYTTYVCQGCGYTYTDCYTLPQHTLGPWQVTKEATLDAEGEETAACTGCGLTQSRVLPRLPQPETTQMPVPAESQPAAPEPQTQRLLWPMLLAGAGLLLAVTALLLRRNKKKGKFQK